MENVADVLTRLAGDEPHGVTGQNLGVNGGMI
jgi:hypothetical protein